MTIEARLWMLSALCAVGFAALGLLVRARPLIRLDARFGALRGDATGLAVVFTLSGRSAPLLILGLLSLGASLAFRRPIWIPIAIFGSQVSSQIIIELTKRLFSRARPDDWLVHHELGFSSPSGHAATAIVFFGAWAVACLFLISAPVNTFAAAFLALWSLGIVWSRMALSAHYLSDVAGGIVFGIGWLSMLGALAVHLDGAGVQLPAILR